MIRRKSLQGICRNMSNPHFKHKAQKVVYKTQVVPMISLPHQLILCQNEDFFRQADVAREGAQWVM